MSERKWTATADLLGPENVALETKIDDQNGRRNEAVLVRKGRLWWTRDGAMYVYYTPTHWRFAA